MSLRVMEILGWVRRCRPGGVCIVVRRNVLIAQFGKRYTDLIQSEHFGSALSHFLFCVRQREQACLLASFPILKLIIGA